MSIKRSSGLGRTNAGAEAGGKIDRIHFYEELRKRGTSGDAFTPVDLALAIGAGEPHVAKALLGLAIEGFVEKVELGRYRSAGITDLTQAEFLKAFSRASKVDTTRQKDLSEIGRLKQNNDVMRARLLSAIAERDHYLAALKKHGIDPGPAPAPTASAIAAEAAPAPAAAAAPAPVPAPMQAAVTTPYAPAAAAAPVMPYSPAPSAVVSTSPGDGDSAPASTSAAGDSGAGIG